MNIMEYQDTIIHIGRLAKGNMHKKGFIRAFMCAAR